MKRNFFGDPIIEPGDDIGAIWTDRFGLPEDETDAVSLEAFEINNEDMQMFGWTCSIRDADDWEHSLEVHGFGSRDALVKFLTDQVVTISDD